jgi:hypothetical protein
VKAYAAVVVALEARGSRRRGDLWSCPCPVHARGDRNPSLQLTEGPDGEAVIYCHAGGAVRDVLEALGFDLTSAPLDDPGTPVPDDRDETRDQIATQFAAARARLDDPALATALQEALTRMGLASGPRRDELIAGGVIVGPTAAGGGVVISIEHHEPEDVRLVGLIERDTTGTAAIKSRTIKGSHRDYVPAPEMLGPSSQPVILCEGEKDALIAFSFGADAISIPGAAAKATPARVRRLAVLGRPVLIVADADDAGDGTLIEWVPALLDAGIDVRVLDLHPGRRDGADLADFVREQAIQPGTLEDALDAVPDRDIAELLPHVAAFAAAVDVDRVLLSSGMTSPPWEALPAPARAIGLALRDVERFPEAFAFATALAPFAMMGTYLRVFTSTGDRSGTPCSVFVLLVGASGTGKSRAIDRVSRWLRPELDRWFDAGGSLFLEWRNERDALDSDRKRLRRDDYPTRREFAEALTTKDNELRDLEKRRARRPMSITGSPTPEALMRAMGDGAVLWINGEASEPLRLMLDEKGSRVGPVVSAWSCEQIDEDRLTSERRTVALPQLSILWGIQTTVLGDALRRNPELHSQGLLPRMMIVPSGGSRVGWRNFSSATIDRTIEDAMRDQVGAAITALHPLDLSRPMRLRLTPEAEAALRLFQQAVEIELRPGGAYADDLESALRIVEHAVRFAGVLHLAAGYDHGTAISATTINGAAAIARWQFAIRSQLGGTLAHRRHLQLVLALARWTARRKAQRPFAVRDAIAARAIRSLDTTASELRRTLRLLEDAGVAIASDDTDSATFALHPDLGAALGVADPTANMKENPNG